MKKSLSFRPATLSDTDTIVQIGAETFKAAFGSFHKPEDIVPYLEANFNDDVIRSLIADDTCLFLLGHEGQRTIGYALLREGTPPELVKGPKPIELVRFYVIQEVIGLGYGTALMRACLEEARKMGHKTIWLAVWQKNQRAIRFYEKWGFRIVGEAIYVIGQDVTDDFIMQRSE